MTEPLVHDMGANIHVYPDEFKVLLKIFNHVNDSDVIMDALTDEEFDTFDLFVDTFKDLSLEFTQ